MVPDFTIGPDESLICPPRPLRGACKDVQGAFTTGEKGFGFKGKPYGKRRLDDDERPFCVTVPSGA
jgi:hypothetical protein